MANLTLLGSPRRGGKSDTFEIQLMCEEGLIASLTGDKKIVAGGTAPFCVTAGRKGEYITGYTTGEEVPVQLDDGATAIVIGSSVYVTADGKATNVADDATETKAIFVSTTAGNDGCVQNIAGQEAQNRKWALITFEGGL